MADRERLRGQTAIVTGGGRGIGRGIATRLAAEGARVIVWDLASPTEAPDGELTPFFRDVVDVTDAQAVEQAFERAVTASPECSFTTGFTFDLTGGRATY